MKRLKKNENKRYIFLRSAREGKYIHVHICAEWQVLKKKKILIGQDYRGDAPPSVAEGFFPLWLKSVEENQNTTPVLMSEETGMNYLYVLHHNIYG